MLATGGCVSPIELEHLLDPRGWMVGGTTNPNLLTTRRPIGSTSYAVSNPPAPATAALTNSALRRRMARPARKQLENRLEEAAGPAQPLSSVVHRKGSRPS